MVIADVRGCTGLTARGAAQAQALADHLSSPGAMDIPGGDPKAPDGGARCGLLLSSPVLRARQTADTLSEVLAISPTLDSGLCELRPGEADGMTWDAYRTAHGAFDLVTEPNRAFSPGGESWTTFTGRVHKTLERLARDLDGQTVVAVTHAGFIVASLLVLFAIPRPGTRALLDPRHTSITEWRVSDGLWQLDRYNDTRHLDTTLASSVDASSRPG